MDKFIWEDQYSVGIKIIDDQHNRFFEIANEIYDILQKEPVPKDALTFTITKLGDYALFHLSTEEKYFKEFKYDGLADHVKKHDYFREKVAGYLEKIRGLGDDYETIAEEMGNFSESWLTNHILETDKKYTQCFKEHGLS